MEFIKTRIPEVILIKLTCLGDARGFFLESYKRSVFVANGITDDFCQDNHSKSAKGVLRGLHYQLNPQAQAKLVRCVSGSLFDVAVDIRKGSPTFGHWVGYELSAENKYMLYIPTGFAHGFISLEDNTQLCYKTSNEYNVACDRGIDYMDIDVGIVWPQLDCEITISAKDKVQPSLRDAENNFIY